MTGRQPITVARGVDEPAIATCRCTTCTDPRAAVIADLLGQCACTADAICAACHALGPLRGVYRCESCRTWGATATVRGERLCDGCADWARECIEREEV